MDLPEKMISALLRLGVVHTQKSGAGKTAAAAPHLQQNLIPLCLGA
jgi:hypothetical protein